MALFDNLKQWAEKALGRTQSNDESILDEKYQEQIDVETPREELFKQNILMGDTGRSEIIGEETTSEDINAPTDQSIPAREIGQEQAASSDQNQNEINIPEFLRSDDFPNSNNDVNPASGARSTFNGVEPLASSLDATEINPVPNDFISSFDAQEVIQNDTDDFIDNINPNPDVKTSVR